MGRKYFKTVNFAEKQYERNNKLKFAQCTSKMLINILPVKSALTFQLQRQGEFANLVQHSPVHSDGVQKRKAAMKSLTVCNSAVMRKSAVGMSKIYCEEYVAQYYTAKSNFATAYA